MIATATTTRNRKLSAGKTVNRITSKSNGNGNGHSHSNGNGHSNGSRLNGSGNSSSQGKPSKAGQPCAAELELLAQRWESVKAAAKQAYAEADQIEQQLIESIGVGGMLPLSDGRTLRVKDNFRDAAGNPKVKHYALAGVKLSEVEIK